MPSSRGEVFAVGPAVPCELLIVPTPVWERRSLRAQKNLKEEEKRGGVCVRVSRVCWNGTWVRWREV